MNQIHLRPNAKVNLGLVIRGKRPDGYHEIQTVFLPAPLRDELILMENPGLQTPAISLDGIQLNGDPFDNLCYKAWQLLRGVCPTLPAVQIHLVKNIPAGAGLGGGSADAAFTLMGLKELFSLNVSPAQLHQLAIQLGADVPFFLENKPMLASGIGEILEPIEIDLPGEIRLLLPDVFSDTRQAYAGLNYANTHPNLDLRQTLKQSPETWRQDLPNDFEPSVFSRFPILARLKEQLYADGAIYASMSGSGSALFGLLPSTAS